MVINSVSSADFVSQLRIFLLGVWKENYYVGSKKFAKSFIQ